MSAACSSQTFSVRPCTPKPGRTSTRTVVAAFSQSPTRHFVAVVSVFRPVLRGVLILPSDPSLCRCWTTCWVLTPVGQSSSRAIFRRTTAAATVCLAGPTKLPHGGPDRHSELRPWHHARPLRAAWGRSRCGERLHESCQCAGILQVALDRNTRKERHRNDRADAVPVGRDKIGGLLSRFQRHDIQRRVRPRHVGGGESTLAWLDMPASVPRTSQAPRRSPTRPWPGPRVDRCRRRRQ